MIAVIDRFSKVYVSGWWFSPARFWHINRLFSGTGQPKSTYSSSNIYYSSFKEGTSALISPLGESSG
ncbi:hypothetical protein [[Phormidium] sp. ETS-05]|uniref:hypothetical protein n=1 Tax=[Phormidium] sp. ETS-05 TaxID=222819 RepID=UPI0018EEFD87|nr:hypothetical protein [[Phormidium] sp. ETS-05]